MPPRAPPPKPPPRPPIRRDPQRQNECGNTLRQAAFHTGHDGVFQNNWGDVLCFPYTLCIKFWECCSALCAGTNYCMIYWLILQWVLCKVNQVTTPHPVVYPYFFNIFFQVLALTFVFGLLWCWYGKSIFIPYFRAYVEALTEVHYGPASPRQGLTRLSYRKYCFRKSEVFEVPTPIVDSGMNVLANYPLQCMALAFNYVASKIVS